MPMMNPNGTTDDTKSYTGTDEKRLHSVHSMQRRVGEIDPMTVQAYMILIKYKPEADCKDGEFFQTIELAGTGRDKRDMLAALISYMQDEGELTANIEIRHEAD